MKLSVVILMIAVSVNLAGCLSSNPSESDAKEVVLGAYKRFIDSGELIIDNVKKIDATKMEFMGVKLYEMKVEITRKFPKGYDCEIHGSAMHPNNITKMVGLCSGRTGTSIAPGFSETIAGKIRFEKSEKGWHGRGCN